MQLFITPCVLHDQYLTINESRIIHQMSKVLRYQDGQQISFQYDTFRYVGTLQSLNKDHAIIRIDQTIELTPIDRAVTIAVALPNKREKAELIVQKLAELGVARIIRRQGKHSQLQLEMVSQRKLERWRSIALEAVEQSRGTHVPEIIVTKHVGDELESSICLVADMSDTALKLSEINRIDQQYSLVIGPEGGLAPQDYLHFSQYEQVSLGKTVLRMETAAICGARGLLHVGHI